MSKKGGDSDTSDNESNNNKIGRSNNSEFNTADSKQSNSQGKESKRDGSKVSSIDEEFTEEDRVKSILSTKIKTTYDENTVENSSNIAKLIPNQNTTDASEISNDTKNVPLKSHNDIPQTSQDVVDNPVVNAPTAASNDKPWKKQRGVGSTIGKGLSNIGKSLTGKSTFKNNPTPTAPASSSTLAESSNAESNDHAAVSSTTPATNDTNDNDKEASSALKSDPAQAPDNKKALVDELTVSSAPKRPSPEKSQPSGVEGRQSAVSEQGEKTATVAAAKVPPLALGKPGAAVASETDKKIAQSHDGASTVADGEKLKLDPVKAISKAPDTAKPLQAEGALAAEPASATDLKGPKDKTSEATGKDVKPAAGPTGANSTPAVATAVTAGTSSGENKEVADPATSGAKPKKGSLMSGLSGLFGGKNKKSDTSAVDSPSPDAAKDKKPVEQAAPEKEPDKSDPVKASAVTTDTTVAQSITSKPPASGQASGRSAASNASLGRKQANVEVDAPVEYDVTAVEGGRAVRTQHLHSNDHYTRELDEDSVLRDSSDLARRSDEPPKKTSGRLAFEEESEYESWDNRDAIFGAAPGKSEKVFDYSTDQKATSSLFKRNRIRKEILSGSEHVGGKPLGLHSPDKSALKIQSLYRGKAVRKHRRLQQISATVIQRIYRGVLYRKQFVDSVLRVQRNRLLEKDRRKRLQSIKGKERDLRLLSTIGTEEYLNYDRMRRTHSAKVIQRAYRNKLGGEMTGGFKYVANRAASTMSVPRFPAGEKYSHHAHIASSKAKAHVQLSAEEEERMVQEQQRLKILEYMGRVRSGGDEKPAIVQAIREGSTPYLQRSARSDYSGNSARHRPEFVSNGCEYKPDVTALGLAQLHRRVSDKAMLKAKMHETQNIKNGFRKRQHNMAVFQSELSLSGDESKAHSGVSSKPHVSRGAGARRKYQDLVEAQQKAAVLLQEYESSQQIMRARQAARQSSLGTCRHLMESLQTPPSLEEARAYIKAQEKKMAAGHETDPTNSHKSNKDKSEIFFSDSVLAASFTELYDAQLRNDNRFSGQTTLEGSVDTHLRTMSAVQNKDQWGIVAIPLPVLLGDAHSANPNVAARPEVSLNRSLEGSLSAIAGSKQDKEVAAANDLLRDAKIFRPLVANWVSGSDLEDSLYWVSYATQPSKVAVSPITPSEVITMPHHPLSKSMDARKSDVVVPALPIGSVVQTSPLTPHQQAQKQRNDELLRNISVEAMNYSSRRSVVQNNLQTERAEVDSRAAVYQHEALSLIQQEYSIKTGKLLSREMRIRQAKAVQLIQSLFRGKRARRKVAAIRSQQRILAALNNLMHELQPAAAHHGHVGPVQVPSRYGSNGVSSHMKGEEVLDYVARIQPDLAGYIAAGSGTGGTAQKTLNTQPKESLNSATQFAKTISHQQLHNRIDNDMFLSLASPATHRLGGTAHLQTPHLVDHFDQKHGPQTHSIVTKNAWGAPSPLMRTPALATASVIGAEQSTQNSYAQFSPRNYHPSPALPYSAGGRPQSSPSPYHYGAGSKAESTFLPHIAESKDDSYGGAMRRPFPPGGVARGGIAAAGDKNITAPNTPFTPSAPGSARPIGTPVVTFSSNIADKETSPRARLSARSKLGQQSSPRGEAPLEVDAVPAAGRHLRRSDEDVVTTASTPVKVAPFSPRATPGTGASGQDPNDESGLLSEFSYDDQGYISSPSQSHSSTGHSLSHSHSMSFSNKQFGNNASNNNSNNRLHIHAEEGEEEDDMTFTGSLSSKFSPYKMSPKKSQQTVKTTTRRELKIPPQPSAVIAGAMSAVEKQFKSNQCHLQPFVKSALVSNLGNFTKRASMSALQSLVSAVGLAPLAHWLARFKQPSTLLQSITASVGVNSSSSVGPTGEMAVESAALLLCSLVTELENAALAAKGVSAPKEQSEETVFTLIQTCMLARLLGSGNDSGLVKVAEVCALLEDMWLSSIPIDGLYISRQLAELRFSVLQQATRKAGSSPRKLFDETLTGVLSLGTKGGHGPLHDAASLDKSVLSLLVLKFVPSISEQATADLVSAIVKLGGWSDAAVTITVTELRELLCTLCSYRTLQKRVQTWFRAVPTMYQSILAAVNQQSLSSSSAEGEVLTSADIFCDACQSSNLPLSQSECFMLSQLLTRKGKAVRSSGESDTDESGMVVDVTLLLKIKKGEFLNANLS